MRPCSVLGCESKVSLTPSSVVKCYYNLVDYHWYRILKASIALAEAGIGPKVISTSDEGEDERCIEYERVTPFDANNSRIRPNLTNGEIIERINRAIAKMHKLGYGHGDLHIGNIGFSGSNIYLLDYDTVYRIQEGPVEWLSRWMEEGFDWDDSFEAFVDNDYDTWRGDWLD